MNAAEDSVGQLVADLAHAHQLQIHGDHSGVVVTGVTLDNRRTQAGDLFAALPGAHTHGAAFAHAAIAAGAVAILTDSDGVTRLGPVDVPVLTATDVRAQLGAVSASVYGTPSARLRTFGVTGTNGKTTTSYLLDQILSRLGRTTGMIGTVELKVGNERTPAQLTTPEAPQVQALLAQMVRVGATDLVMEVSSHALAQGRADGIVYDLVAFTHLSADHLDFHGGMDQYFQAKASLFTPERSRRGVVLTDDAWGRRLADEASVPVVTVATQTHADQPDPEVDWLISVTQTRPDHTEFAVTHRSGRSLTTHVSMPGLFNVSNAALAVVMALESGVDLHDLHRALGHGLTGDVPGRMERVAHHPRCIVDFAHNTEALVLALTALRSTTKGRLTVVFGATGERDTAKRSLMGAAAVAGADVVVVTDDDPHDEDPAQIRTEVMAGALNALAQVQRSGRAVDLFEVAPRAAAIRRAVTWAGPEDTVLIAGRGHETIQEIAGVEYHLDDRQEVRAALTGAGDQPPPPTDRDGS